MFAYAEHPYDFRPDVRSAAPLIDGPFPEPAAAPLTLEAILLALTGQSENSLLLVRNEDCERLQAYLEDALVIVSEQHEAIPVAAGPEPNAYQRLAIAVTDITGHGGRASGDLLMDLDFDAHALPRFAFTFEGGAENLDFPTVIDETDDDPYFDDDDTDESFHHSDQTNVAEIEEVTRAIATYFDLKASKGLVIQYLGETEREAMEWRSLDEDYDSVFIGNGFARRLFDFALQVLQPAGYTYQYNDGRSNRQSGYDQNPESLIVEIDPPTSSATLDLARRAMAIKRRDGARQTIVDFLEKHGASDDVKRIVARSEAA